MAASSAESATGTDFSWNSVAVVEVNSVGDIDLTADDIEVTHYNSDDGYKEYIQGLRDGGEIAVEGNFIPSDAGQAALLSDFNAGTVRTFLVTLPNTDASTWSGSAYIKGFTTSQPINDKIMFTATLKLTGKPSFTV